MWITYSFIKVLDISTYIFLYTIPYTTNNLHLLYYIFLGLCIVETCLLNKNCFNNNSVILLTFMSSRMHSILLFRVLIWLNRNIIPIKAAFYKHSNYTVYAWTVPLYLYIINEYCLFANNKICGSTNPIKLNYKFIFIIQYYMYRDNFHMEMFLLLWIILETNIDNQNTHIMYL